MASTSPKPFVFVLMPFSEEFSDVYTIGIKAACRAVGAYCERVDEQDFEEASIVDRIYNQIAKADIIVSDTTGRNPNVYYETGYSHALGKRTILITQSVNDIPFDLKHRPHIPYQRTNLTKLRDDLKRRIRYHIQHPDKKQAVSPEALEYYVNGKNVETCQNIDIPLSDHDKQLGWTISVGIHNPGDRTVNTSEMRFGFVFPAKFGKPLYNNNQYSVLPGEKFMFDITDLFTLMLPKCWINKNLQIFNLLAEQARGLSDEDSISRFVAANREFAFPCAIRAFTELGMREHRFTIWIK